MFDGLPPQWDFRDWEDAFDYQVMLYDMRDELE